MTKTNRNFLGVGILFLVLAAAFSVIFWPEAPAACKICLFVLGFGSGLTIDRWLGQHKLTE